MTIDHRIASLLSTARDVVLFQPGPDHRRARANFWAYFTSGEGMPLPARPDLAIALQYGGDKRIAQWWDLPGFQDWFLNREEFRQRISMVADMALDELETILSNRAAFASDKLKAIVIALQYAAKAQPDVDSEKMADAKIGKMNRAELEEFIRSNIRLLPVPATEELTPPDSSVTLPSAK